MSRNGESLSDWQDIVNGINERISASDIGTLIPVPVSKSHIRSDEIKAWLRHAFNFDVLGGITIGSYVDKNNPIISIAPGDPLWTYSSTVTGKTIYGYQRLRPDFPPTLTGNGKAIFEDVPEFGSVPPVGSRLSSCGWFLDQMDDVLGLLSKVGTGGGMSVPWKSYHSYYTWNVTTGEITDNLNWGTLVDGVTMSSYQDFYNFVLAHFQEVSSVARSAKIEIMHYQGGDEFVSVELIYQKGPAYPPGGVPGDLTAYVSTTGDNLGWPVTNYEYTDNNTLMQHIDYTSKTFQNVTPGVPANIGFDSSTFATAPTLPALGQNYVKAEDINQVWCVWDFAPYFQY